MIAVKRKILLVICISVSAILVMACGLSSVVNSGSSSEVTPTPTEMGGEFVITPTKEYASRCENLNAAIELQVLVGPAEAVDLEPVAVGDIPFSVTTNQPPYLIEGSNTIEYEDMLAAQWGTYTVTFNMDVSVTGECAGDIGAEQVDLVLEMTGDQNVVVEAEGFQGEYPWSGTITREIVLPLEEGASTGGEGWQVVLHIGE